jgi:ABC-2 type transport system ATP-binding protein
MDEAEYCNRIALINAGRLVAIGSPSELRRRDLGGVLFEFACAPLGAALAALRQAPGVIDAAIFGDKLHVLVRDAAAASGLPPLLEKRNITVGASRSILPSLEDVFVRLVSRRDEAEARV